MCMKIAYLQVSENSLNWELAHDYILFFEKFPVLILWLNFGTQITKYVNKSINKLFNYFPFGILLSSFSNIEFWKLFIVRMNSWKLQVMVNKVKWDFPDISCFPMILSFKLFGNSWKFTQPSKNFKILWTWLTNEVLKLSISDIIGTF